MRSAPHIEYVELSGGTVTASYVENASGRHARPEEVGSLRFFVEVVDPCSTRPSSRIGIWDGNNYGDAIVMAEETRRALRIKPEVRDIVVTGGAA